MSFTLAIVGRPNVGKSTLFNRLAGRKLALVDDTPGVTRDRRVHAGRLQDLRFDVIDTAGLEEADADSLEGRMRAQSETAIDEADIIIFMIDARAGLMPDDKSFADVVRRKGKPVVLVANKSESRAADAGTWESYELGLGEPISLSAEHGQGMPELRDAIVAALGDRALERAEEERERRIPLLPVMPGDDIDDPDAEDIPEYDATKPLRIAVVGRPNAGKSTLINSLIGQERLLTGPEAGITRDSISVDWEWRGRRIKLFDTAGLRRKSRVQEKLEKLFRRPDGLRAIRFAEVGHLYGLDRPFPFEKPVLQIAIWIIREAASSIAFNNGLSRQPGTAAGRFCARGPRCSCRKRSAGSGAHHRSVAGWGRGRQEGSTDVGMEANKRGKPPPIVVNSRRICASPQPLARGSGLPSPAGGRFRKDA